MAEFASTKLFIFASLISVALCGSRVVLDGNYHVSWTVADGNITVTSSVKTLGWVGFGISETDSMVNSDLVLAGRGANGAGYVQDSHGLANTAPVRDTIQNVELLSATENSTHTTVTFTRKVDTGDAEQDKPVLNQLQNVLFAYGETDDLDYHGGSNRGAGRVNLIAEA